MAAKALLAALLGLAFSIGCSSNGVGLRVGTPPSRDGFFNVRDYGAKGNGRSDDTGAIRHALAAAIAQGGGTIFFPPGTYSIEPATGPFFVASNVTFAGAGRASVIRIADNAGQYNDIFAQHPGRLRNLAFRDLRFDQNPRGNQTANINPQTDAENVIQIYSFDDVVIDRVAFDPEPGIQAIVAAGPNHPDGLTVDHCFFVFVRGHSSNRYYDASTIYTEAGHIRIFNNRFETSFGQNAITAIELHGGPDVDVAHNQVREFEIGMNLVQSTTGYPEVPAAHFAIHDNHFLDAAFGIDFFSVTNRVLRAVAIDHNEFSFSQHALYHNTWIGIEFQPGGASQGLGGDFRDISVDRNTFDFSLLAQQRIATAFSAAFDIAPDSRVERFYARRNRMIEPPATGINVGKAAGANRSAGIVFEDNRIEGAGWDPEAPPAGRAAVVLHRATMRGVHVDRNAVVAPAHPDGVFSFVATPARDSTDVTIRYDHVTPAHLLAHRIDKRRVDTTGTTF